MSEAGRTSPAAAILNRTWPVLAIYALLFQAFFQVLPSYALAHLPSNVICTSASGDESHAPAGNHDDACACPGVCAAGASLPPPPLASALAEPGTHTTVERPGRTHEIATPAARQTQHLIRGPPARA